MTHRRRHGLSIKTITHSLCHPVLVRRPAVPVVPCFAAEPAPRLGQRSPHLSRRVPWTQPHGQEMQIQKPMLQNRQQGIRVVCKWKVGQEWNAVQSLQSSTRRTLLSHES